MYPNLCLKQVDINSEHFLNSCVDRHYDNFSCRYLNVTSVNRLPEFFNPSLNALRYYRFQDTENKPICRLRWMPKAKAFRLQGALPLDPRWGLRPQTLYRLALPRSPLFAVPSSDKCRRLWTREAPAHLLISLNWFGTTKITDTTIHWCINCYHGWHFCCWVKPSAPVLLQSGTHCRITVVLLNCPVFSGVT